MKKAIIIGATSGIGKGLAKLLANNGYKVGITGRRCAVESSARDEGRPFALGLQEQGANHRKRRWSKALVVSITEKSS